MIMQNRNIVKSKVSLQSLIECIKTNDIYKGIADGVETAFDTSNYNLDRPLPKEKNKRVIGLIKDELVEKS